MEYRAEPHYGKLTMLMALSGVPLSTPVTTSSGRVGTLADVLQDTVMNFGWDKELEFAGCSFAFWLPPEKSWTNKFGEEFTFDELMQQLLKVPLGKGCCGGCHIPYTVVILLRVNEQYQILSKSTVQAAEIYLNKLTSVLESNQLPDGSWERDWGKTGEKGVLYNDLVLDKITILGHHLEWLALVNKAYRPSQECIKMAIKAVTEQIQQLPPLPRRSFKTILPCSHAGKALSLLADKEPYPMWLKLKELQKEKTLSSAANRLPL